MNTLLHIILVIATSFMLAHTSDVQSDLAAATWTKEPLVLTIPRGAYAAELGGDFNVSLPKTISIWVGQLLVVKNDDVAVHYLMSQPLMPGQATTVVFDSPGKFAYYDGLVCALTHEGATTITVIQ